MDMTKVFLSSACFRLLWTDVARETFVLFMSGNCIGIFFWNVVVENLDLHYHPSLYLYWLLPMWFVVEYSHHTFFYQMIYYQVIIWLIETMIQCWE